MGLTGSIKIFRICFCLLFVAVVQFTAAETLGNHLYGLFQEMTIPLATEVKRIALMSQALW